MGKYVGKANTDTYGLQLPELRPVLIDFGKPTAASTSDAVFSENNSSSVVVEVTDFDVQPPEARGLKFTPDAAATGSTKIIVEGVGIDGQPIVEEITTNSSSAVVSAHAYKEITKVVLPKDAQSITWKCGYDARFGLPYAFATAPFHIEKVGGVIKYVASTVAVDGDVVGKNTIQPSAHASLNGSTAFELLLFV